MTQRIILAMMLMGVFASCSNEQIDKELIVADMANLEKVYINLDTLEQVDSLNTLTRGVIPYIEGPFIATKTVTYPLFTSTTYDGCCTLSCTISYEYYAVYPAGVDEYDYLNSGYLFMQEQQY